MRDRVIQQLGYDPSAVAHERACESARERAQLDALRSSRCRLFEKLMIAAEMKWPPDGYEDGTVLPPLFAPFQQSDVE